MQVRSSFFFLHSLGWGGKKFQNYTEPPSFWSYSTKCANIYWDFSLKPWQRLKSHLIILKPFDLFTSLDPWSLSCRNLSITRLMHTFPFLLFDSIFFCSVILNVSFSIRTHFRRGWSGSIHNGGPRGLSKGPHNRRDHCNCSLPAAGTTWHQQALARLLSGLKFHFPLLYAFSRIRTSSSLNQATPYSRNFLGKRWPTKEKNSTRFS